jgi:hypothetical protein
MIKNGKYSVIYKQLIKFSPDITRNTIVDLFSGIICRTSPNVSSHLVTIQNLVKQQPRVRSFLNDFFQPDYVSGKKYLSFQGITKTEVSLFRRGIELLSGLLFEFSIIFVELYTLFRMLKPPAGSSSPFLVMGFYGATHTRNMVAILQDVTLFSYEVVYEKRYRNAGDSAIPPDYRCVAIDTPINLARDLEERAQAILAHPAHRSAYENYQRVIQAEQMGREPAASLIPAPPVASNAPIPVQNAPKKTFKIRKSRRAPNVALPAIPNAPVSLPVPVPNAPKKTSKVRKPRRAPNAPVSLPNAPAAPALSNAPVPLPVPVPNAPKKTFKIRKSRRAPNAALPAAPASSSTIAP